MALPSSLRALLTGPPPPPSVALLPDEGGFYGRDGVSGTAPAAFPVDGDTGSPAATVRGHGVTRQALQQRRTRRDHSRKQPPLSGRGTAEGGGGGPQAARGDRMEGQVDPAVRHPGHIKKRRCIHSPAVLVCRTTTLPCNLRALLPGPPPSASRTPPRRGRLFSFVTKPGVPLLMLRLVDGDTGSPAATGWERGTGQTDRSIGSGARGGTTQENSLPCRGGGPPKAVEGVPCGTRKQPGRASLSGSPGRPGQRQRPSLS